MTELILGFGPQLVDEKSKDVSLLHIAAFNGLHLIFNGYFLVGTFEMFTENNKIQIMIIEQLSLGDDLICCPVSFGICYFT